MMMNNLDGGEDGRALLERQNTAAAVRGRRWAAERRAVTSPLPKTATMAAPHVTSAPRRCCAFATRGPHNTTTAVSASRTSQKNSLPFKLQNHWTHDSPSVSSLPEDIAPFDAREPW